MSQSPNHADLKRLSRGWSDEMTPEEISARLQKLSQMYRAWERLNLHRKQPANKACRTSRQEAVDFLAFAESAIIAGSIWRVRRCLRLSKYVHYRR